MSHWRMIFRRFGKSNFIFRRSTPSLCIRDSLSSLCNNCTHLLCGTSLDVNKCIYCLMQYMFQCLYISHNIVYIREVFRKIYSAILLKNFFNFNFNCYQTHVNMGSDHWVAFSLSIHTFWKPCEDLVKTVIVVNVDSSWLLLMLLWSEVRE